MAETMKSPVDFAKKTFDVKNINKIEKIRIRFLRKHKIIVFVPPQAVEKVHKAMSKAGGGIIGKYTECSYRLEGKGTFRGGKGTNPYLGKKGLLEEVSETRLEMICKPENLNNVVEAMLKVHPYEEPAYDIYEIKSGEKTKNVYAVRVELKKPAAIETMIKRINGRINSSFMPERFGKAKVRNILIDFSGDSSIQEIAARETDRILYITKKFNKSINIRLL
jgi:hypothetical protein